MSFSVNFDLNNGCQLRCGMCRPNGGPTPKNQALMSIGQFRMFLLPLLHESEAYQMGCLSEPTIVPQISNVINMLPLRRVGRMNTNGMLLNERLLHVIDESRRFLLVKVSFDAAFRTTFEHIRVGSNHAIVMRNIRSAVSILGRDHVALVFTLQPANLTEASAVVQLASDMGASGVYVHPLSNSIQWCVRQRDVIDEMVETAKVCGVWLCGVGSLASCSHTPKDTTPPHYPGGVIVLHDGQVLNGFFQPMFNLFDLGTEESLKRIRVACEAVV